MNQDNNNSSSSSSSSNRSSNNNSNNNSSSMNDDANINAEKGSSSNMNDDGGLSNELSSMNIDSSKKKKKNCLHCLQEVEGSSRCSKCRTALYCSRACQEKHWPVHKNNCTNSNAEDSDLKLLMKALNHSNQGNFIIYTNTSRLLISIL